MTVNCLFHQCNYCEFVKHRCHHADSEGDYPKGTRRKRQAKEPCEWAKRYAEREHVVTLYDAKDMAKKLKSYGASERQVNDAAWRLCLLCEKPITPFEDELGHKTYKETGLCHECQVKEGALPPAQVTLDAHTEAPKQ